MRREGLKPTYLKASKSELIIHAGQESEEMFKEAGIAIEFFNDNILKYSNQ